MRPGEIVKVRVGKHPKPVMVLAVVNAGKTLRVANLDKDGRPYGTYCVAVERVTS
jgi:hypothetical protein